MRSNFILSKNRQEHKFSHCFVSNQTQYQLKTQSLLFIYLFSHIFVSLISNSLISQTHSSWTPKTSLSLSLSLSLSQISVSLRSVVLSLRSMGLYFRSVGAPDQWVVFVSNRWDFLYFISLSLTLEVEISMEIDGGTLWWWVCGLWFLLIWVFTLFKSGLERRA